MKPRYKEEKTAQMAALFLTLRGGKMSHLKLLKLMYMVDREALRRLGRSVSFDNYSSMEHGPILSTTYDRIKGGTLGAKPPWEKYITTREGNNVRITWTMGAGKTNALQRTAGGVRGSYNTNNFTSIFTATNTVGTTTNYLDVGAATNTPARYYRVRLVP